MQGGQQPLAIGDFERYRKPTRREQFLVEMNTVVPWSTLVALIEPVYSNGDGDGDGAGRPPAGLERMLRIHCLQHWFNLSDPGVEEALYDSRAIRGFVAIDLGREPVPDETTICKFRHLLEAYELRPQILLTINAHLASHGFRVTPGTIVDATIIAAPSSTKNEKKERDPEMHQRKKGNAWHFGMKAHIGIDSRNKIIHSVAAIAANVHDARMLPELLHGNEKRAYGDSGYQGQSDIIRACAPEAKDFTNKRSRFRGCVDRVQQRKNRFKSQIRARVEHPFLVIKRIFGFAKVRYRGLKKNTQRLYFVCGLTNLYLLRRPLLARS